MYEKQREEMEGQRLLLLMALLPILLIALRLSVGRMRRIRRRPVGAPLQRPVEETNRNRNSDVLVLPSSGYWYFARDRSYAAIIVLAFAAGALVFPLEEWIPVSPIQCTDAARTSNSVFIIGEKDYPPP